MDKQTTDQVYRVLTSIEQQNLLERLYAAQARIDAYYAQLEAERRARRENLVGWVWFGIIMTLTGAACLAARHFIGGLK